MDEYQACHLCPRDCGVNRYERIGFCQATAELQVAKAYLHRWEEPCISGSRGSGTVFFSHCNLRCVYCQNHEISQGGVGKKISVERLAEIFLELETQGAHNINLVTALHYLPHVRKALLRAKAQGLKLPIIYNTSAYEHVEALKTLEGLVDVYLPDLKYQGSKYSQKYSQANNYFKAAAPAVLEMYRQVGKPVFNPEGFLIKGLMIRHLLLPGLLFDSKKIIDWVLNNLPSEVYLNLMSQYTPLHRSSEFPEINQGVLPKHYEALLDYALGRGLENGFYQEPESASSEYVPPFDGEGV